MWSEVIANIWCSGLIRAQFGRETYITIHDVTLDMQREVFMQPHGLCRAEFEIWHMQLKGTCSPDKALYITTFSCIFKSATENVETKNLFNTHARCA